MQKYKKRTSSYDALHSQKSEFEFTFLFKDFSEVSLLLNFLHRKYKEIYNNIIFARKKASLNSDNNNAIILIYMNFFPDYKQGR